VHKDILIKAMDLDNQVRVILARTTDLVNEAARRHKTSATAAAALGRVITAALIMGSDLKGEKDMLTIRIDGKGPGGALIASADAHGTARALISNPQADVPSSQKGKLAVGELVGREGFVEVIKDLGLKQPFVGKVELVSGEIAEDIAHYYLKSEQTPSLAALGVMVAPDLQVISAGGLLVQAMPGASDDLLLRLEENIAKIGKLSIALEKTPVLEDVMARIMEGIDHQIVGQQDLHFKCSCSFARLKNILGSLAETEMDKMWNEDGQIEIVCNFCNEVYHYTREDIRKKAPDIEA
jgi:molecular chaperone Hsp33